MSEIQQIDTGDTVHHGPSDEDWIVAYVEGGKLAWCGWPEGEAELSDCTLKAKATPEERFGLLLHMANGQGNDSRNRYARRLLSSVKETP